MEQFSSKGIKNVTMDNISSLLGISKRTLYEIFPDKETLLVCCMELSEIKAQEYLKTVLESSKNVMEMVLHVYQHTITRFQSLNPSFLQEITKYPKAYQLYLENREASSERAYQFFQDGVNQRLFRSDVNFTAANDTACVMPCILIWEKRHHRALFPVDVPFFRIIAAGSIACAGIFPKIPDSRLSVKSSQSDYRSEFISVRQLSRTISS